MAAARKARPGVYCPPYPSTRLSDVARAGLAEALRTLFSPPEEIPVRMVQLLKQLENVPTTDGDHDERVR